MLEYLTCLAKIARIVLLTQALEWKLIEIEQMRSICANLKHAFGIVLTIRFKLFGTRQKIT